MTMEYTRLVEAAVEDRQADGAICAVLLMPNPPDLTRVWPGSSWGFHWGSGCW